MTYEEWMAEYTPVEPPRTKRDALRRTLHQWEGFLIDVDGRSKKALFDVSTCQLCEWTAFVELSCADCPVGALCGRCSKRCVGLPEFHSMKQYSNPKPGIELLKHLLEVEEKKSL